LEVEKALAVLLKRGDVSGWWNLEIGLSNEQVEAIIGAGVARSPVQVSILN